MATGKITKRSVDAQAPGAATSFLWDDEIRGFGLRVTTNGAKSYVYQYRMGGRAAEKKRYTIGKHGSPWTPVTAREEAARLAMMVGQGTDPAAARSTRRLEAISLAFDTHAELYVSTYLKENWKDGGPLAVGILRKHAKPAFAGLTMPQITRGHLSRFFDTLAGTPAVRRNAFAVLRRMFRWSVNRGDISTSPMNDMDPPPMVAARDRVLEDWALPIIWDASADLGYPFGPMYRLLMVEGQRREEVAGLSWTELDQGSATWTLPADRSKNGQAHIIPLNALAGAEIDALAAVINPPAGDARPKWPRSGLLFSTTGTTPASGYSKGKARLDRAVEELIFERRKRGEDIPNLAPWRVHDLRRTLATGLQRLGIRFEVTEAVLNHVSGARSGVAGVYQRHDWKEEKRAALGAWAAHLFSLINNETPLGT